MAVASGDLKCLIRVKTEIPVIKLGYDCVTRLIDVLKDSSLVMEWSLNQATNSVDQVVNNPYIRDKLLAVDQMLCTSLDLTELNLPALKKTPHEIYNESIEYVMGLVAPITDWVDVELLLPLDCYVDRYLPELDPNQKTRHVNDGKRLRACELSVKLAHRVKQHAYAEPMYIGYLLHRGFEEMVLLMKILIFDPKLLSKTFHQIWKKLGDGVTPNEAANSLLLVEMGCIRLRNVASTCVQMIEITAEMAKCYIEMFIRYVNSGKNFAIKSLSRVVNPATKKQIKLTKTSPKRENSENAKISSKINLEETYGPSTSTN